MIYYTKLLSMFHINQFVNNKVGLVLLMEPTVPTGDVEELFEGVTPTPAQLKVQSFNSWIELVKRINETHSVGFTDLSGGTLVAFMKNH